MRKIKEKLGEAHVLLAPPFFWLLIFFVVPLFIVLVFSVGHRGTYGGVRPGFTIQHYKQVLTPLYLKIVWRSFIYALATTVITLLVAYPIAYYMACASARMKTWLMFLVTLPFWTNLLIRLYAFVVILGGGGVVKSVLASLGWGGPLDLLRACQKISVAFCISVDYGCFHGHRAASE
jgi:spermidine/putrescine transport system permease protein